ncbi:MAG: HD domain-containing protein [Gammaproteobacteria bacterium]|nr:HD domain-containing protein [Gammaproteobacteria bacterium]
MRVDYFKALKFAIEAHKGQLRKHTGAPFVIHPIRVAESLDYEYQRVVALLHDVIEDCDVSQVELNSEFGAEVAKDVLLLTHAKGVTYKQYIKDIADSGNMDVIQVKIRDILDNITDHPSEHMLKKSVWALEELSK